MLNKAQIIGRVGRDPEVRFMPSGEAVCNISIATTEKWKDKTSGEVKEATEWHRVSAWGKQAELAGQYLKQGSLVYIEGKMTTRKYTDKDGVEKSSYEIRMTEMKFLSRKDGAEGQDHAAPTARPPQAAQPPRPAVRQAPAPAAAGGFDDMDDDIPFFDPLKRRAVALAI